MQATKNQFCTDCDNYAFDNKCKALNAVVQNKVTGNHKAQPCLEIRDTDACDFQYEKLKQVSKQKFRYETSMPFFHLVYGVMVLLTLGFVLATIFHGFDFGLVLFSFLAAGLTATLSVWIKHLKEEKLDLGTRKWESQKKINRIEDRQ